MGRYFPDVPARNAAQMGNVIHNPTHLNAEEGCHRETWGYLWGRSSGTSGEHPKGLALDFSGLAYRTPTVGGAMDSAKCTRIANWLWANRARLGVWYIIWNRRIISTNRSSYAYGRWVAYRGSNPHTDHVHVSYYASARYAPPPQPKPPPVAPKVKPPAGWKSPEDVHELVMPGDTLNGIVAYYNDNGADSVTVDDIVDRNGIDDPNLIQVGQRLWIPAPGFDGPARRHRMSLGRIRAIATRGTSARFQDNSVRNLKHILRVRYPNEGKVVAVDGFWGPGARQDYARWQRAYSASNGLGWSGSDVNGTPGSVSLNALAELYGFEVV